jgi:hypothetical protein
VLARVPEIRRAAAEGTQQSFNERNVLQLDAEWQQKRQVPPSLSGVLQNPAARFLADVAKQDTLYREILVTDRQGRLVAASQLTTDYYQADEPWWTQALDDGRQGRITVSDVRRDDSAGIYAFDIAVPVADQPHRPGRHHENRGEQSGDAGWHWGPSSARQVAPCSSAPTAHRLQPGSDGAGRPFCRCGQNPRAAGRSR